MQEVCEPVQEICEPVQEVCEPVQEICEPVQEVCEPVQEICEPVQETTIEVLEESFGDLLAECYEAAKSHEDVVEPIENTIEEDSPLISFAPEFFDSSIVENYAGNFSVTFADSLRSAELSDISRIYDQMNFDPQVLRSANH